MKYITHTPPAPLRVVKLHRRSRGFPETRSSRAQRSAEQRSAPRSAHPRSGRTWRARPVWPSRSWRQPFTCSHAHPHTAPWSICVATGGEKELWSAWSDISDHHGAPLVWTTTWTSPDNSVRHVALQCPRASAWKTSRYAACRPARTWRRAGTDGHEPCSAPGECWEVGLFSVLWWCDWFALRHSHRGGQRHYEGHIQIQFLFPQLPLFSTGASKWAQWGLDMFDSPSLQPFKAPGGSVLPGFSSCSLSALFLCRGACCFLAYYTLFTRLPTCLRLQEPSSHSANRTTLVDCS